MTLLFIDGFDHYDPQQRDAFDVPWLARGKAAELSATATRIPGRRPSSFALRIPAGADGGYRKTLDSAHSGLALGAAFRFPEAGTGGDAVLLGVADSGGTVEHLVKCGEDRRLRLYRRVAGAEQRLATSVATLAAQGWHYVELQIEQHASAGTLQVRLNGILALRLTAQNTLQSAGPLLTAFLCALPAQPAQATLDVDDFYVANSQGTLNNSFLGDVRVDVLQPDGAGSYAQFAVTPPGLPAWEAAADADEATWVSSTTAGQRQTFRFDPLPVMSTPTLCGVQLTALARQSDAGAGTFQALVVSGAVAALTVHAALQEQALWHTALIERNPNGAGAWTEAGLNAAEFGVADPVELRTLLVEVLWRDTSAAAIVAGGFAAFGDIPWPAAEGGVFAFRHDWSQPLVEQLAWRTHVETLASGNEVRTPLRLLPRRTLHYSVGHGRPDDGLVADWLADHLGKAAWWPLPQHGLRLVAATPAGALALAVEGGSDVMFGPLSGTPQVAWGGLSGWQAGDRWCLCWGADGWQVARLLGAQAGLLVLAEPLARALSAGSLVCPLVQGVAEDDASFVQHVPGLMSGTVAARMSLPRPPWVTTVYREPPDDPLLDTLPVWPDGNWDSAPGLNVAGRVQRFDAELADPWTVRANPVRSFTLECRYLIDGAADLAVWLKRLWLAQGRYQAFWLPDAAAPGMTTTHDSLPTEGYLRVTSHSAAAFMHRPAACAVQLPSGATWHVLTNGLHHSVAGTALLVLGGALPGLLPAGSRVQRLLRCRLAHDVVELVWHTDQIVELALSAQTLPDPRGRMLEAGG